MRGHWRSKRLWGAAALLVFAWALVSFAVRESPSYQECYRDQKAKRSPGEKEEIAAHFLMPGIAAARIRVRCLGTFLDVNNPVITALSTVIIAVFTTILGLFTIGLARATRIAATAAEKAANVAEQTLTVLEQPFIMVQDVSTTPELSRALYDLKKPIYGHVEYGFANHGRTAAVVEEYCAQCAVVKELPETPTYSDVDTWNQPRILAPGNGQKLKALIREAVTPQLISDLATQSTELFLFGYIRYRSFFDYTYVHGFCWRYNINAKRFYADDKPGYSYRRTQKPGETTD